MLDPHAGWLHFADAVTLLHEERRDRAILVEKNVAKAPELAATAHDGTTEKRAERARAAAIELDVVEQ